MCSIFKREIKLVIVFFILFLGGYFAIQFNAFANLNVPFKTTKPKRFTILLKNNTSNPTKVGITFYEYKPSFRVDQTFGLIWGNLDFSSIEQVYLGMELFKSKEQYFSLYNGKDRIFLEEIYNDSDRFEKEQLKRNEIPLKERNHVYYSKILIETNAQKYMMAKNIVELRGERIPKESAMVNPYLFTNNGWKNSTEIVDDLSMELFTAYKDKDTSQFLQWLKEKQIKKGPNLAIIFALIFIVITILIIIKKTILKKK